MTECNSTLTDNRTLDTPPRLVLASLSGQSDATWARQGVNLADMAVLGGIAIDSATRQAAREMVGRDRDEFLPADPVAFVDRQFEALESTPILPGINVRTRELDPLAALANVCCDYDALLEINAHCRQSEMCAAGSGETLLADTERLCEQVRTVSDAGALTGVKVRTEVPGVDLEKLTGRLSSAGVDVIHVDAMDSEPVVGDVVKATDAFVIANNEVRDRETVREYLEYGADAVSVGRPSTDDSVLSRVRDAVDSWFDSGEMGDTPANPSPTRYPDGSEVP